jgi:flavodoxin
MQTKKILIVYYSRTGTTKKVAEMIAAEMRADMEEIADLTDRSGMMGYLKAGRDAMKNIKTEIAEPKYFPANYDLVIIGCPVWGYNMPPAMRAYLGKHAGKFKSAALFCTMSGSGGMATLKDMEKMIGKDAIDSMSLKTKEVQTGSVSEKLKMFIDELGVKNIRLSGECFLIWFGDKGDGAGASGCRNRRNRQSPVIVFRGIRAFHKIIFHVARRFRGAGQRRSPGGVSERSRH